MALSAFSHTSHTLFTSVTRLCIPSLATFIWPLGSRHLYAPASMGLENFVSLRQKTEIQFTNKKEKFKEKMDKLMHSNDNVMVFTEDLKSAVFLAEATEKDLSLVLEMAKKFNQQYQGLRFGAYVFGPVVMRMYHYLNQPDAALAALKTKELDGFFDQMISYHIAMDLLYKSEKYEDVLDVFELVQEKRIAGVKYPKNCFTIAVATFYKLVIALCELDRIEDALPLLRSLIQIDLPATSRSSGDFYIVEEAVLTAETASQKTGKKELIAEFEHIKKSLLENNSISDKTLDMILSEPIETFKMQESRQQEKAMLAASFYGRGKRPVHHSRRQGLFDYE
ncbi:hypothetical protein OTU49_006970 [Cherax quadricarinatus]|uniref:Pentatricopeptide repeat-containing protein 2, mitochondrial n=1 Tax=Cherax quadricarinatus TaxID=27406 RepID=A0AAW0X100_CHEQU